MFMVVDEAFMRELEGEMDGELAVPGSAFVSFAWLCGWSSCEDDAEPLR